VAAEFITPETVVTYGVAAMAITAATNTIQAVTKGRLPQVPTAFAFSVVLAYALVCVKEKPAPIEWLLAFFNAYLLYCTAAGIHHTALESPGTSSQPPQEKLLAPPINPAPELPSWRSPWRFRN
jgi:hypothetical protein